MSMFRRKHHTEVYDAGFGQWNFRCSCGAQGRTIPQKAEITEKARLHEASNR